MNWRLGKDRNWPWVHSPRGGGPWLPELAGQAEFGDKVDPLWPAGEQGLGAGVDRDPGNLADRELAAEPGRGLQHGDGRIGPVAQEVSGGQAGDAAADDRDLSSHCSTLARS